METIKREARIVMPTGDMHGDMPAVHGILRRALAAAFGGFTQTAGEGGWVSPSGELVYETVFVYDVAILPSQNAELARIAVDAGRRLGQHSVYVRYSHGVVDIIDVAKFDEEQARGGEIPVEAPKPAYKHPSEVSIGDIWKTNDGSIVAFTTTSTTTGTNRPYVGAILLKQGKDVALGVNAKIGYRATGRYGAGNYTHPLDLARFVGRWDGATN